MSVLSIIIPSYNEGEGILEAANVVQAVMKEAYICYEIIFVDDGSKDNTWEQITSLAKVSENIKGIKFSKNFGKESAMLAGLSHAKGDACVIMDCDLQHPPQTIIKMYEVWLEGGVDVVEGVKESRRDESLLYKRRMSKLACKW